MRYVYSVIRFVPDPARGEFVNIGAIVGTDLIPDWGIRNIDNTKRARALDDRGVLPGILEQLDKIARRIDAFVDADGVLFRDKLEVTEKWLQQLSCESQNILQFSNPTPVIASSSEEALEIIFNELLVDPLTHRQQFKTKNAAMSAIAQAYSKGGLLPNLHKRATIHGGKHSELLDFTVANGRVVQLTQCYSFQIAGSDDLLERIKALAWTLKAVREGGGKAIVEGQGVLQVPADVDVEVVYVPPETDNQQDLLEEAQSAFFQVQAVTVPYEQAATVASKAQELLGVK